MFAENTIHLYAVTGGADVAKAEQDGTEVLSQSRQDSLRSFRGIVLSVVLGMGMWAGLVVAGRALWHMIH